MKETPSEKVLCDLLNDTHESLSRAEEFITAHSGKSPRIGRIARELNALYEDVIKAVSGHAHNARACVWCKHFANLCDRCGLSIRPYVDEPSISDCMCGPHEALCPTCEGSGGVRVGDENGSYLDPCPDCGGIGA